MHFVVRRACTLLGPFIIMLSLEDHTLCLEQLYSCIVKLLSCLCTHAWHFIVATVHTLCLAQLPYNLTSHTRGAHTVLGSVLQLYIYTQLHCTHTLHQWRHLALNSELPGANSSITSETFRPVSTNHRARNLSITDRHIHRQKYTRAF